MQRHSVVHSDANSVFQSTPLFSKDRLPLFEGLGFFFLELFFYRFFGFFSFKSKAQFSSPSAMEHFSCTSKHPRLNYRLNLRIGVFRSHRRSSAWTLSRQPCLILEAVARQLSRELFGIFTLGRLRRIIPFFRDLTRRFDTKWL